MTIPRYGTTPSHPEQSASNPPPKRVAAGRMRLVLLAALLLPAPVLTALATEALDPSAVAAPPPLAPGHAPPLPASGALAAPRSPDQAGFPATLTASLVPPQTQTPEILALGEKLFFEPRLSGDGTVACATCHDPARAFTDGRPTSIGIHGRAGQRNAPTVLNALYNKTQFWDGRAETLEQQAALPVTNPDEMGAHSLDEAAAGIAGDGDYQRRFMQAFGRGVSAQDMLGAIAAYERSLTSFDAPFDHFIAGDASAISDSAKRGWELFNTKARCNLCHALLDNQRDVTLFTDNDFHDIGIGILKAGVDALASRARHILKQQTPLDVDAAAISSEESVEGRFLVTRKTSDIAAFKTPGLRNVLVTAPYFHDGSMQTLWDVLDHYNKGDGITDPWLDQDMQPLALTEAEIDDVVAFLASLTSAQYQRVGEQEYARQLALSRTSRPQRDTARAFAPKHPQPPPPF